jgi:MFS family permease
MKWSSLEGSLATIFVVLTVGSAGTTAFLTGYALFLGASDFDIGIMASLPFALQFLQFISAALIHRIGARKIFVFITVLLTRSVFFVLVILPFLTFFSTAQKIIILNSVLIFANSNAVLAGNAWNSWVAELFPEKIRGTYFGYRTGIFSIITVFANLLGGVLLDYYIDHNQKAIGFSSIMLIASICGTLSALTFLKHPERTISKTEDFNIIKRIKEPLKDLYFRKIIIFFFLWNLSVGLSAPFFGVHMIRNLNMTFSQMSLQQIILASIAFLSAKIWGNLIDRFGSKSVLLTNAAFICLIPIVWLFATKDFLLPVFIDPIISGICWTGFNLAAFTFPLDASKKENRSFYLAMFGIFIGLGYLSSSLIGGAIAQFLSDWKFNGFGYTFINFHILFILSFLFRFISALNLSRLKEPEEKGVSLMFVFVNIAFTRMMNFGDEIFPFITRKIPKKIIRSVGSLTNEITSQIENFSDGLTHVVTNISDNISVRVDTFSENVTNKVEKVSSNFANKVTNISEDIKDKVGSIPGNISNKITDSVNKQKDIKNKDKKAHDDGTKSNT